MYTVCDLMNPICNMLVAIYNYAQHPIASALKCKTLGVAIKENVGFVNTKDVRKGG